MSVKGLILIILLSGFISINSYSQINIGIWGGLNSSSFGGNPPEDANFESIYGISFGGSLDYKVNEDAIISLEPSFEQKGSEIVFGDEEKLLDTVRTYKISQNYFGIGVLFKINTERFFVGGGLSFQLLSSARLDYKTNETDIKENFLNYDVVSFFNVGYKIPIGVPVIFIELRYIQGLVNINEESDENSEVYISNFKSTGLKLSTGIIFPL